MPIYPKSPNADEVFEKYLQQIPFESLEKHYAIKGVIFDRNQISAAETVKNVTKGAVFYFKIEQKFASSSETKNPPHFDFRLFSSLNLNKLENRLGRDLEGIIEKINAFGIQSGKDATPKIIEPNLGYFNQDIKNTLNNCIKEFSVLEKKSEIKPQYPIWVLPLIILDCITKKGKPYQIFAIGSDSTFICNGTLGLDINVNIKSQIKQIEESISEKKIQLAILNFSKLVSEAKENRFFEKFKKDFNELQNRIANAGIESSRDSLKKIDFALKKDLLKGISKNLVQIQEEINQIKVLQNIIKSNSDFPRIIEIEDPIKNTSRFLLERQEDLKKSLEPVLTSVKLYLADPKLHASTVLINSLDDCINICENNEISDFIARIKREKEMVAETNEHVQRLNVKLLEFNKSIKIGEFGKAYCECKSLETEFLANSSSEIKDGYRHIFSIIQTNLTSNFEGIKEKLALITENIKINNFNEALGFLNEAESRYQHLNFNPDVENRYKLDFNEWREKIGKAKKYYDVQKALQQLAKYPRIHVDEIAQMVGIDKDRATSILKEILLENCGLISDSDLAIFDEVSGGIEFKMKIVSDLNEEFNKWGEKEKKGIKKKS